MKAHAKEVKHDYILSKVISINNSYVFKVSDFVLFVNGRVLVNLTCH